MSTDALRRPRPVQGAAAVAVLALGLVATLLQQTPSQGQAQARWPSCWSAQPLELAPLACGEHGALTDVAGR
jgi:hypothetical protein